jgi:hypothetical protein
MQKPPAPPQSRADNTGPASIGRRRNFVQRARVTIAMADSGQLKPLVRAGGHVPTDRRITSALRAQSFPEVNVDLYDLVAVRPTSERTFNFACQQLEVDIISLDLSRKLPFHIKRAPVTLAISRGLFFEMCYSPSIRGASPCGRRGSPGAHAPDRRRRKAILREQLQRPHPRCARSEYYLVVRSRLGVRPSRTVRRHEPVRRACARLSTSWLLTFAPDAEESFLV